MKYIVTGTCGFIGSHTVERLLNDGHKVIGIDNLSTGRLDNIKSFETHPNLALIKQDINNLDHFEFVFENVDCCIHLAALADIVPSIERPYEYHRANVDGTFKILELCRRYKVKKFVYAASSSCYGITETHPTKETDPISPQYPYALTKYLGEQYALTWGKIYKIPVISLRFFNVYGPRSRTSGTYGAVFGTFLAQKLNNKPLTVVGNGLQSRDFIYVSDVVEAIMLASKSNISNEIFNVGTGLNKTILRLADMLSDKIEYISERPGEPFVTCADITKIYKTLGFLPKVSFEEGVKKVLDNIEYWRNAPVWDSKSIEKATKTWFECLKPREGML